MALSTQTKILRVLQEGDIQRVGGSGTIKVDVRIIAATNKNLEEIVEDKTFREDLYYRLNVVRIRVPPLRERKEDIPKIVDYMLQMLDKERKTRVRKVSPEALAILCAYQWPGNVRELENVVYRSAVVAQGDAILIKDLPEEIARTPVAPPLVETLTVTETVDEEPVASKAPEPGDSPAPAVDEVEDSLGRAVDTLYAVLRQAEPKNLLKRVERELVDRAYADTGQNQARTAELLGMTRTTLKKRLQEYGMVD